MTELDQSPVSPSKAPLHVIVTVALAELGSIDRSALELIYWHGRTQAEVAAELHVAVQVVRVAVGRGMQHVARRVEGR